MDNLALHIEAYLLVNPRWVPVAELCERLGIDERQLRAKGRRRPIHARFAISSTERGAHGLKHIRHATKLERIKARNAARRRIIAGARALRDYRLAVANCLSGRWPDRHDLNGQTLLPIDQGEARPHEQPKRKDNE